MLQENKDDSVILQELLHASNKYKEYSKKRIEYGKRMLESIDKFNKLFQCLSDEFDKELKIIDEKYEGRADFFKSDTFNKEFMDSDQ